MREAHIAIQGSQAWAVLVVAQGSVGCREPPWHPESLNHHPPPPPPRPSEFSAGNVFANSDTTAMTVLSDEGAGGIGAHSEAERRRGHTFTTSGCSRSKDSRRSIRSRHSRSSSRNSHHSTGSTSRRNTGGAPFCVETGMPSKFNIREA